MLISKSKRLLKKLLFFGLQSVFLIFLTCLPPALCSAGEIVAIVNKSLNITKISFKDLKLIYLGRKKSWPNGEVISIFLPPSKSKPMNFLIFKLLKFSNEGDLSRFYLKSVFQEVFINPPISVVDTDFAIANVMASLGGIALVEFEKIPKESNVTVVHLEE